MPEQSKFEDVDLFASLNAVMKQNTGFYQSDLEIDKEIIAKAAASPRKEDMNIFIPYALMPYYGAMPGFAKLTQKKNAAILKKDYNALYTLFTCDGHLLSALCFDFRYLLCRCAHNPYALIAHTVKERVKLPPLRVLFRRRFQKELVYGYIVAEHKLKENL